MIEGVATEYAEIFFDFSIVDLHGYDYYEGILSDIELLYGSLRFILYVVARAYMDDRINSHFKDFDMNCILDEPDEPFDFKALDLDDKNVSLLYDLIGDLEKHRNEFWTVVGEVER